MDYPAAGGNPTGEGWSRGIGLWVTLVILSRAMYPTNGLHEPQEGMGMETSLPTIPSNLTRNGVLESRVRVDWLTLKRGENRKWNEGVKLNKSNHPMAMARKRREDEEGLDPENKIQKVALEFKRQELAAKKKRMEQERMRTLSEQYEQLEKQSNDWRLATSSKNLFLDLVQEIATELGLTNCWICGGLKSAERWPWKGESLTPEQLLKWDNKILNTLTRPGGWTLDERVIGTICISREGNVYSDVVGYTPCLSTLAVNSNNRSKMWQPEPPNGYWGKEKQEKCNWVEEIELCWHEFTNANPYSYSLTELVEFWDKPENIDIKWKAPSGIYWICGKRAYSELPRKWKGSCTLEEEIKEQSVRIVTGEDVAGPLHPAEVTEPEIITRSLSLGELRDLRREFTCQTNESILTWLLRIWDAAANDTILDGSEARQLGSLSRDVVIDQGIGRTQQTLSLWQRLLTSMRDRYLCKEDLQVHQGKWSTMEQGIRCLRELAVLEIIFSEDERFPKSPDDVQCTSQMWLRFARLGPEMYSRYLATLQWREGEDKVGVLVSKLRIYEDTVTAPFRTHVSSVETRLAEQVRSLIEGAIRN
ncbi:hypothetical protein DUI87_02835 [Hirundo rustica rustica]|uniref:Uncharacterized protein n=1 Tax=Hirundo rustica rustica TaxID=333673 RepID=A0A3M0LDB6_HIRRU|nr:hypothetical protein DUI87_02835 [Hirundo rustica rustica]